MGHGCLDGWVLKAGYLGASPACARGIGLAWRGEKNRGAFSCRSRRERAERVRSSGRGFPFDAWESCARRRARCAPARSVRLCRALALRCPPWPRTAMRDATRAYRPRAPTQISCSIRGWARSAGRTQSLHGAVGELPLVAPHRPPRRRATPVPPVPVTGGFLHAAHVNRLSAPDLLPSKHHTWAMHGDRPRRAHDMAHLGRARARLRGGHVVLHLVKWTIDSP
jgi:hypothetical protein